MAIGPAVVALVAIAALVIAGSGNVLTREFVLGAPAGAPVALLRPSQQVCEGPVTAQNQIQAVSIWGGSVIGLSKVQIDVQDAGSRELLATGRIKATALNEYVASLDNPVAGSTPLRVCVVGALNTFSLLGSATVVPSVVISGKHRGAQFSLALLNDERSLWSSLPTAFSRASLWRPGWVRSWIFWVLLASLLATFGVGVVAVAGAASADDQDDRPPDGQTRDDDVPPTPDNRVSDSTPTTV